MLVAVVLRKPVEAQDVDGYRRPQFAELLAAAQLALVKPRPVEQGAPVDVIFVANLDFDVDQVAGGRPGQNVQPGAAVEQAGGIQLPVQQFDGSELPLGW
jgi:hypothetical protein